MPDISMSTEKRNREVWEGWTVQDFIDEVEPLVNMVMSGKAHRPPFKTGKEMQDYVRECQPYYKKPIPEVMKYFENRYHLDG